jgi:hypothetical protein
MIMKAFEANFGLEQTKSSIISNKIWATNNQTDKINEKSVIKCAVSWKWNQKN